MGQKKKKNQHCCTALDIYVFVCIISGLLCLSGAVADFFLYSVKNDSFSLLRFIHVNIAVGAGGLLCFFQSITCWRHTFSSAMLGGYSAILVGINLGLRLISFWNNSSNKYVKEQFRKNGVMNFRLENLTIEDEFATYVLGASALVTGFAAFLDECLPREKKQSICSRFKRFIISLVIGCTIVLCTLFNVFITSPTLESHGWLFNHLLMSITQTNRATNLMASVMGSGAIAAWLTLVRTRKSSTSLSFLISMILIIVLLCHISIIVLGVVDFKLPDNWKIYPQEIIWIMFSVSSIMLFITLILKTTKSSTNDTSKNYSSFMDSRLPSAVSQKPLTSLTTYPQSYPIYSPTPHEHIPRIQPVYIPSLVANRRAQNVYCAPYVPVSSPFTLQSF